MSDEVMIGRFKATPAMAETHDAANKLAPMAFRQCVEQANAVYSVMNEPLDGVIQHGARLVLHRQFEAFFFSAQALLDLVPDEQGRDWFPWMVARNRQARGSMGLPGWMQRLIDRNGGVIPETWSNEDVMSDVDITKLS